MRDKKKSCVVCGGNRGWKSMASKVWNSVTFQKKAETLRQVPAKLISDNPYQSRTYILADPHDDLKISIAQYGVIVPIIVNRKRGGYTLVAGQRRLQAIRELGKERIPAIIRNLNQREMMEITYLENLHREDLSQVDLVKMFDRLQRRYPQLQEEELAVVMGLDTASLHRARTLLKLPIPALEALRASMINEEQARIVSEIEDPDAMLEAIEIIYQEKLSGESAQALVDRMLHKPARFISNEESPHFHNASCPFAQLIPEEKKSGFYSRDEANKKGKIACMQCL